MLHVPDVAEARGEEASKECVFVFEDYRQALVSRGLTRSCSYRFLFNYLPKLETRYP